MIKLRKVLAGLLVGLLLPLGAAAAPTSTTVQNLIITGLSSSGSPCLRIGTTGLVATTTCGTASATTTINGVSGPTFTLTATSSGNTLGWTGQALTIPKNVGFFTNDAGYTTLSSLSGTAPILYSSGTGAISLATTSVTAGSYTSTNLTVDAWGRITAAANGTGGGGGSTTTINGVTGPTFTFNTSGTNGLSYSTSTGIVSLTQATSTDSVAGFLSAADHAIFAAKQAAGNYITALTGDGTASGPGSVAFTLATVNSNVGTYGSTSLIPTFTVNGKGLITAASTSTIAAPAGALTGATLASGVTLSSLTQVGTIATGTWNGTKIGAAYGGTNLDTSASTGFFSVSGGTWAVNSTSTHRTLMGLGTGDSPTFTGATLSGLTNGSVLFATSTGVVSQSNASFFWDNTNSRLGIGTATPGATLHVSTTSNPIGGLSTWSRYQLLIHSNIGSNLSSGICFAVTTSADNCGAAIVHNRIGGNSQGSLNFYTKATTTQGTAPLIALTLNSDQTADFAGTITSGIWGGTAIGVTKGGTGLTSLAQGDLVYGSASNTFSALAKNTTATRYLANTGTSNNPQWDLVNLSNGVTSTLALANGGTGLGAPSITGQLLMASSTSAVWGSLAAGSGITITTSTPGTITIAATAVAPTFGDGSDGNVTISSPTTLARDMYYNNLTVSAVLTTNGYRIFVKGTISGTSTVDYGTVNNGSNGASTAGGAGGLANTSGGYLRNTAGANGANSNPAANGSSGVNGYVGTSTGATAGSGGCNGGCGTPGGTGGTQGSNVSKTALGQERYNTLGVTELVGGSGLVIRNSPGAPGGGSGASTAGGGGGGGGSSGGIVFICANTWAGTFTIKAVGGNGGNGAQAASNGHGGGGGGNGGNGGIAITIYGTKTWSGSYTLTAGSLGTHGNGLTTGSAGTDGVAGTAGTSYEYALSNLL